MTKKFRNLVVDLNNIGFYTRHSGLFKQTTARRKDIYAKEAIFRRALSTILLHAQRLRCNAILIAKDSKGNWRKEIYSDYKNRDYDDDIYFEDTLNAIEMIASFFSEQTGAYVLAAPKTEADDIIAHWCMTTDNSIENVILSNDQDYNQLINSHTFQYNMREKAFFEVEDPAFELFVKTIRGDSSDNIRSAYPRVRKTVLEKAWNDEVEMLNLINHQLDENTTVGELLDFNISLIDMSMIPQHVRETIETIIQNYTPSKYNGMKLLKWLGEREVPDFSDILEMREHTLHGSPKRM